MEIQLIIIKSSGDDGTKSLLIIPLVVVALLAPLYASVDVEKGLTALESSDFAMAAGEFKKASQRYRLAADEVDAIAQFSLGVMYDNGRGVLQDNVYAHM